MTIISEIPIGACTLVLSLRPGGRRRVKGKVVENKHEKYFITHHSPKESFGPGTKVLRYRKEVKM